MKLYKALKLRKSLVGEIAKLKEQINSKNSYLEGSVNPEKFDVQKIYDELLSKIDQLVGLKYAINSANAEIQAKIYVLSEYKALISFWNIVNVKEGLHATSDYSETIRMYSAQFDEIKRNKIVGEFQKNVDALQEEIDTYNYTTEIPWGDEE